MNDLKEKEDKSLDINDTASSDRSNSRSKTSVLKRIALNTVFGIQLVLAVTLFSLSLWYRKTYSISFKDLLYIITGPVEGTGSSMVHDIVMATVPAALGATVVFAVATIYFKQKNVSKSVKRMLCILCSVLLVCSIIFTSGAFRIGEYLMSKGSSTLYEDYYVDPNSVAISATGDKRNLIYIYIESLENSHLAVENGGVMTEDYLPGLTALAKENICFSNLEEGKLGGFRHTSGSGWTIAALLATTSGVPFSFPIEANSMSEREQFAPGLTTLGDILEKNGYTQEFLCGSDAAFAGRDKYFTQHGNYSMFDLFSAREAGYVPSDYHVWWGYEDKYLFNIARDEATRLANGDAPFNLTMLTVDLHSPDGYICGECTDESSEILPNVLRCTDKLVCEFVEWCKAQPFYENTTIVITGDHFRHDKAMIKDMADDQRTIYNCFINSAAESAPNTSEREWTSFDVFPTTLAALGFDIEGERLGLGTNMFSGERTLCEQMGFETLNSETGKDSEYYLINFYYTEDELGKKNK